MYSTLTALQGMKCEDAEKTFEGLYNSALQTFKTLQITNYDKVGEEGLISGLTRVFVGILNTIIHIANTFKTNIFKFYRTLKRTELVYYTESNALSIKRILNYDYGMYAGLTIPLPNKMQTSYLVATTKGHEFLTSLGMENRTKLLIKHTEDLRNAVLSSSPQEVDISSIPIEDLASISKGFESFNKCFIGPNKNTKKFMEVFASASEFNETYKLLMDATKFQYSVKAVDGALDTVTKNLTDILAFLEKNTGSVTKNDLMNLSKIAMVYAKLFDMFGLAVMDMARIEHNFVVVLQILRKAYNL